MTIRRAGILDTRIAIQRKSTSQSNSGEIIETWTTLATRWAEAKPLTGSERMSGENLVAKEQMQFRFRWDSSLAGLSPLDRIVMPPTDAPTNLEIYDIVQASMVDRNEDILVLAFRFANAN